MRKDIEIGAIFYISYSNKNDYEFVEVTEIIDDKHVKVRSIKADLVDTKIAKVSFHQKVTYDKYELYPGEYISEEFTVKVGEFTNRPLEGEFDGSWISSSSRIYKDHAWINEDDATKDYYRDYIQDELDDAEALSNSYTIDPRNLYKILLVRINNGYTGCPYKFIKLRNMTSDDVGIFAVLDMNIQDTKSSKPIRGWHELEVTPKEEVVDVIQVPYKHGKLELDRLNDKQVEDVQVWDGNPVTYTYDTSD